jgi:multidrug resistance efflux pump
MNKETTMTKRIFFIIFNLVLIGALLGACGAAPATATPAPDVVEAKNTNLSTAAEGNLEPVQSVALNFTGSGLVTEVNAKKGSVKAGDVIARLKSAGQLDALAEAEAALAVAKANQAAYQSELPQLIAAAEADVKAAQAEQAGAAAGRDHQAEIVDAEAELAQAQFNQQRAQTSLDIMYEYNRTGGSLLGKVQLAYENAVQATQPPARLKALQPVRRATSHGRAVDAA